MMDATRDTVRSIQKNGDAVSACGRMIGVNVLLAPAAAAEVEQSMQTNWLNLVCKQEPATALLSNGSLTENDEKAD